MPTWRHLVAILAVLGSTLADAGVLYKSVDANGRVTFSDTPPPQGAKILEQREIRGNGAVVASAPTTAFAVSPDFEADVQRANALVDQAERALALARRELWSPRDGLRLVSTRRTAEDDRRLAIAKKEVLLARQALLDVLRERKNTVREPGTPYVLASR
jgi:hypothetical protein